MVKKVNRSQTVQAAPVRAPRKSSALTRKQGRHAPQSAAQHPQYVQVAGPTEAGTWLNTSGTYKGRRGKKQAVPAAPPVLPQLGAAATAVPGLVPAPGTVPEIGSVKRPGDDLAVVFTAARRWLSHYRWQLAPLYASAITVAGAAGLPGVTVLGLGAVAGAGYLTAAKGPDELAGRVWLSRAERRLVGRWATGAAVWSGGLWLANAGGLDWSPAAIAVAAAALGLATGEQLVAWLKSRRIRRTEADAVAAELSAAAVQLRDAWPHAVAAGPAGLVGSEIVDLDEPEAGTIIAVVQLRDEVHAVTVATDEVRQWLERALRMGVGTARVETVRDDAGQIRLVLTPSRQLEKVEKIWPGPVLYEDGRVPVAVGLDGKEVCLRVYNGSGVYHHLMLGSSGSGKSNTLNVMLLPTVVARLSVMVYLDGKEGTSSPRLARAMDTAIRNPKQFGPAIEMVYRIAKARKERYGEIGEDDFVVSPTGDPIIELVIDECSSVLRHLDAKHEEMLEEIAETGRALGIALKYSSQSGNADKLPGGMAVRNQMMGSVGNVVGLRPGGTQGQTTTLQSTTEEVNLLALPGGDGAGGWCAIMLAGQVVGYPARMMFDPKKNSRVDAILDGFKPRSLEGDDLKAGGEFYRDRPTGAAWYATMQAKRKARDARAAKTAEAVEDSTAIDPDPVTESDETDMVGDLDAITSRLSETLDSIDGGGRVVEIGQRQRAKGSRNRQVVLEGLRVAGPDGTTAADLAAAVGLGLSTVNAHVTKLVSDGEASREGTLIRARLDVEDNA
jgi:hypothetical protein